MEPHSTPEPDAVDPPDRVRQNLPDPGVRSSGAGRELERALRGILRADVADVLAELATSARVRLTYVAVMLRDAEWKRWSDAYKAQHARVKELRELGEHASASAAADVIPWLERRENRAWRALDAAWKADDAERVGAK